MSEPPVPDRHTFVGPVQEQRQFRAVLNALVDGAPDGERAL